MRPSLAYEHSFPRRVVFPFYSVGDVALVAVLIISGFAIIYLIGVTDWLAITGILFLAYIGSVITSNESSPAVLYAEPYYYNVITAMLRENDYIETGGRWIASRVGSRWAGSTITLKYGDKAVEVRGPHDVLYKIKRELESSDSG